MLPIKLTDWVDSPEHAHHIHPYVLNSSSRSRNLYSLPTQPTLCNRLSNRPHIPCRTWPHVTHIKLFVTRHLNNLPLIGWLVGFPRRPLICSRCQDCNALPIYSLQNSFEISLGPCYDRWKLFESLTFDEPTLSLLHIQSY